MIIGKCFFSCYASWRLNRARRKLNRIKLNNYRKSQGLPPIYTRCQKISNFFSRLFKPCTIRLKKAFCPCCLKSDERSTPERRTFHEKIWVNGTRENHIAKTVGGFIIGILLSILVWKSAHADPIGKISAGNSDGGNMLTGLLQKQREPSLTSKIVIIISGICFTLALAFSEATRCVLVLAFTQFFTNKGRAALLAYTLILALSGPAENTTTNMEILTESLACGQELLKSSILDLFAFVKQPFTSFQKAIGHVISSLQGVFGRMRDELEGVVEAIKQIVETIKDVYQSLKDVAGICEHEFGSPYDRCIQSFEEAEDDCREKLDMMQFMCGSLDTFSTVCNFGKAADAIMCFFPGLIKEHVFNPVVERENPKKKKIIPNKNIYVWIFLNCVIYALDFKTFARGFRKFFDARLNVTYKLDHHFERDKTFSQIFSSMKDDILGRCQWIFKYINWVDFTLMFPILFIIFKWEDEK